MNKIPTVTNSEAVRCIAWLGPFKNHGETFYGRIVRPGDSFKVGDLESSAHKRLKKAVEAGPVYVVYSYDTPIGWCPTAGGQPFAFPNERYSSTTSRHQSLLGRAASLFEEMGFIRAKD